MAVTNQQRILFIDDDPDTLILCAHLFRKRGYIVKTLEGCENLIDVVEQFFPHLIFMDHNMPKVCGTEAIKLLKLHVNFKHIPIILFSADNNIEQLAQEAGADAYFKKPFRVEAILDAASRITMTR